MRGSHVHFFQFSDGRGEVTSASDSLVICTKGDVTADGSIDVLDALRAVNIILGSGDPATDQELCAADVDREWTGDCHRRGCHRQCDSGETGTEAPAIDRFILNTSRHACLSILSGSYSDLLEFTFSKWLVSPRILLLSHIRRRKPTHSVRRTISGYPGKAERRWYKFPGPFPRVWTRG
jgi:hypothetical protein